MYECFFITLCLAPSVQNCSICKLSEKCIILFCIFTRKMVYLKRIAEPLFLKVNNTETPSFTTKLLLSHVTCLWQSPSPFELCLIRLYIGMINNLNHYPVFFIANQHSFINHDNVNATGSAVLNTFCCLKSLGLATFVALIAFRRNYGLFARIMV